MTSGAYAFPPQFGWGTLSTNSIGRADRRTIGDNIIHCNYGWRRQQRVAMISLFAKTRERRPWGGLLVGLRANIRHNDGASW
jgi:hypothetical protein